MTEQDLIELGFKKLIVNSKECEPSEFYYYTYDFNNGSYLMSSDSYDVTDGEWCVGLYDLETIKISYKEDVRTLIEIIERNEWGT